MSTLQDAENIVKDILSYDKSLSESVKMIHVRLKELADYHDQLPAIGIKSAAMVNDPETGEEYVDGFCEVVALGEYDSASVESEAIGQQVYEIFKNYGAIHSSTAARFNGIETRGLQAVSDMREIGIYSCVAHVYWRLWF